MSLEQEYQLDFFKENGFVRKRCPSCEAHYWTQDRERTLCGDPPCAEYRFIGQPVTKREFSMAEMRERFLSFFEERGHARIERYPVVARWRDDIYLTIASIADFQPHVTSGEVPPPANPLTISQPCIRLNDLDSVGKSGRHLTNFEMMAHHAFNYPDEKIYFSNRCTELCHEFMTKSLGMPGEEVTYKEKPWAGGGNAGAAFEVLIGGLEVATLVFMNLEEHPDGDIELYGKTYRKMDLQIVDTGYGLERLVWASKGTPTIYQAIYPHIVDKLVDAAGLRERLDDPKVAPILEEVARLASIMDVDTGRKLQDMRREVHKRLRDTGVDVAYDELVDILEPLEAVYAVADHTRCLAYMLGDGIVPSNVKGGYLARLVIRRTLRLMEELGLTMALGDLVAMQLNDLADDFPDLRNNKDTVLTICALETERYAETMEKGKRLVRKEAQSLTNGHLDESQLIDFYDSHGIPPDVVRSVAREVGVDVEVPDDFYARVADKHSGEERDDGEAGQQALELKRRLKDLPPTDLLYYESGSTKEFEAVVLWAKDGKVALDQTAFYPEGGGQPADAGHLHTEGRTFDVKDVQKVGDIVVHHVEGKGRISTGEVVTGRVDWGRRLAHTRHHTATHVVVGAARRVLGPSVWQAGAQKGAERSRIDVTHYRRITQEELREIEQLANLIAMDNLPVEKLWMPRDEAERKYGMQLYQGGIPKGHEVRVVRILDFDVECCGGTHVKRTSDVGPIKILGGERVQDGVERIHFSAGMAAVKHVQERDQILNETAQVLSVPAEDLPKTAQRFFTEWKDYRKQVEDLRRELAQVKASQVESEDVGGVEVLLRFPDDAGVTRKDLFAELTAWANQRVSGLAVGATQAGDLIVVASEEAGVDAPAVLKAVTGALGGKGGGRGHLAQGKVDAVDADAARDAVRDALAG